MIRAEAVYMVDCDYCGSVTTIYETRYYFALLALEKLGWKVRQVTVNQNASVAVVFCPVCVKEGHAHV